MKTFISKQHILLGIATLAVSAAAFGDQTFSVENNYDKLDNLFLGHYLTSGGLLNLPFGPSSLSDTFNLTTDGFVVGLDTAVSGTATIDVTDFVNPDNKDRISIDLGDLSKTGAVHDYSFSFNSSGGVSDVDVLADINADGKLDYMITATKGNFFVNDAVLTVDATVGNITPDPAPDGGSTMTLLGVAVLGIFAVGRKFRFLK